MEIVRVCVVVQMKNPDSHPSQKIILKITIDAEKIPTTKIIKKV